MCRFSEKPGPAFLTPGRVKHLFVGTSLWGLCLWLGVDEVLSLGIVCVFGFGWEASTPWLAKPLGWGHPYGDIRDWIAYLVLPVVATVLSSYA